MSGRGKILWLAAALLNACAPHGSGEGLPVVRVDRDDIEISGSCRLVFIGPVADANGNGVLHVAAPNVVLDLGGGTFRGCEQETPVEQRSGIGIRATAPGLVVRNGSIRGFRTAIYATGVDTALVEDLDLSENFTQRLASTPQAEDGADWLWPHANDGNEWLTNYGAALYLENCRNVVVRRVKAWHGQNGIVLDRVQSSQIYDNDCSFLSGWGIALWRSSDNTICRNALDFCVRGYSHGVYNRGQDSAGILCFEQSSRNVFALNSVTHGGDGFFGFAGKEALGDAPAPVKFATDAERTAWYRGRGCNENVLYGNDFSYAVAHGIEHTFSFDNRFLNNICTEDAICGVWGGYSQRTTIRANRFAGCGAGAYGGERGGVNIEHGMDNRISANVFDHNKAGVHLWWDEDAALMKGPWAQANIAASARNWVVSNTFVGDEIAVELKRSTDTVIATNTYRDCGMQLSADSESKASLRTSVSQAVASSFQEKPYDDRALIDSLPGATLPVGKRAALGGREAIQIGVEGPFNPLAPNASPGRKPVQPPPPAKAAWTVRVSRTDGDPRENEQAVTRPARSSEPVLVTELNLPFGMAGPSELRSTSKTGGDALTLGQAIASAHLPKDHFGITASASFQLAPGCWQVRVTSDDGVRVRVDGTLVVDNWTWHGPTVNTGKFTVDPGRSAPVPVDVSYFELDGYAVLNVVVEPCPSK